MKLGDLVCFFCGGLPMKSDQAHIFIHLLAGAVEYTDCFSAEGKTPSQRVSWI